MANSDMIVRVQADTKNYDANLAKASKTLKQFADNNLSMGGILKQSTGALTGMAASVLSVTAAIGAAKKVMGDMVRINMQFEQSSSNLASVLGKSASEITALTDQAKNLGATTRYTAMQILELQANLARLGFNENEILNSTKAVQGMATAMGADLGEAANLAGSALRGFGLNATEMERVASVLSVSTTKSALSFEKLATALPVVQTAAAKTGFTIEDTVAMLGKLTDNGINAASAATQLRKILNDSTTAGTKLANALGGPVKSFDELVVALDKAGKAGQNHADSVALVNSKNATALDILRDMAQQREVDVNGVKKQTSALQELRDSITDCAEGMRDMQRTQDETLSGSIKMLGSAWEGLMLTFSESNGVIKTVVDSLSSLLNAWTKWRQRNAGGDTAIKSYELSEEDIRAKGAERINAMRQATNGRTGEKLYGSDDDIKKKLEEETNSIKKQEKELKDLMTAYKEYFTILSRVGTSQQTQTDITRKNVLIKRINAKGYEASAGDEGLQKLYKDIAAKRDEINIRDFMISSMSAPEPGKQTAATEDGKDEDRSKSRLATLKAQYEEQEKLHIASLDRMHMKEEDYEASVYKIKRETLQKIADLYQEETAEKARANAAISQLDIAYQGTQMRLANKGNGSASKPKDEYTGVGEYSNKAVNARLSTAKKNMDESEINSDRYLYEADKIVDLTSFQNLLKAATESGLNIDTSYIEEMLGNIDMGVNIPDSAWEELVEQINKKREEMKLDPIELDVKTGGVKNLDKEVKATTDHVAGAAQAFSALGNAMNQIEDPGAKVAGMVAEAIASIASGYGAAVAQAGTGSAGGPWGWIAFAISGVATMIATIAAVKSATSGSYANGGQIPGNSYSGDNMRGILPNGDLIGLDAGEVILNRAQQGSIASQLQGTAQQSVMVEGRISGKDILLSANNTNRAAGGSRGYYTKVK